MLSVDDDTLWADPAIPTATQTLSPGSLEYGTVIPDVLLQASCLPASRGDLSEFLVTRLGQPPDDFTDAPGPMDHPIWGEDSPLALFILYELFYRGFAGVSAGWEWMPALIIIRRQLERRFDEALRREIRDLAEPLKVAREDMTSALRIVIEDYDGPSMSAFLATSGSIRHFQEFVLQKSIYQLKEADPHSWAIPRLSGEAKAALIEIQLDEYGNGIARDMHQNLFGLTMMLLGLNPEYNFYLPVVPGSTLSAVNISSYFGLNRSRRGALVGHLAAFEMTSVEPMASYAAGLRRLGLPAAARHYFEVHVVADAHHQVVASDRLAGALSRDDPALTEEILFGAASAALLETAWAAKTVSAWRAGRSSLLSSTAGCP